MGCFFACFRFKDDDRRKARMVSTSLSAKNRGPVVSKNQLASLFDCEDGSPCKKVGNLESRNNFEKESIGSDLKREAKFLKSCGALLDTPSEIQKVSQKTVLETSEEHNLSSNSGSLLSGTPCKKLLWDEQDHLSSSPKQAPKDSESLASSSGGCDSQQQQKFICHGVALNSSCKSVRFESVDKPINGVESTPGNTSLDISPPQDDSESKPPDPKPSPYPAPLKLTDEMQTPGTVYPANNTYKIGKGKNARIRTQYVFPVLNTVENSSQWKVLREGSHKPDQPTEETEQEKKNASPTSSDTSVITYLNDKGADYNETTYEQKRVSCNSPSSVIPVLDSGGYSDDQQLVVSSLSQWLKPSPANDETRVKFNSISENSQSGKSPRDSDRPIVGMVAAHWHDDESSFISPKWWDGNGIPNSTNKYKEDQKVSWHATPFEERLEKALSDEKLYPQRKMHGKIVEFDEGEESDTAAS